MIILILIFRILQERNGFKAPPLPPPKKKYIFPERVTIITEIFVEYIKIVNSRKRITNVLFFFVSITMNTSLNVT